MGRRILFTWILVIACSPLRAFAQSPSSAGALMGKVIPSGPDGVTEIFGVGGLRYATSGAENSQWEMGMIFGAAGPIHWQDVFVNSRYNMRSYGFTNHVGVGLDLLRYRSHVEMINDVDETVVDADGNPVMEEKKGTALGLHIVGGLSTELMHPIHARADMKLNLTPDLILTISVGLEWRFGEPAKTISP